MSGFRSATRVRRPPPPHRAERFWTNTEVCDPGHVPTLPVPRPGSRGRLSPKSRPHLFRSDEIADLLGFSRSSVSVRDGTEHETCASRRGISGEYVPASFASRATTTIKSERPRTARHQRGHRGALVCG